MTGSPDAATRLPGLTPLRAAFDFGQYGVGHPEPYACSIAVGSEQIGQVIPHVSNIEYVRWLDRAAELHADSLGYTRQWLLERGIMWFVARHEIDYLAEAWLEDELIIATWVRDMRKVKSWRDYLIIRPADQSIICRASTLWVLVDLKMRKPIRVSPDMVQQFQPLEAAP